MRSMKFISSVLLVLIFAYTAHGEIAISVTNEVDDAGATVDVTVSIADTTGSSVLTNYNIPILFGPDPGSLFTLNGTPTTENPNGWANFSANQAPASFNLDWATSDSGAGITLSSTAIDLFTFNFSIDPSAPADSELLIEVQRNPTSAGLLQLTLDGASITSSDSAFDDIGINNGSIVVQGIPEPSSLCVLLLGGVACFGRRRRVG